MSGNSYFPPRPPSRPAPHQVPALPPSYMQYPPPPHSQPTAPAAQQVWSPPVTPLSTTGHGPSAFASLGTQTQNVHVLGKEQYPQLGLQAIPSVSAVPAFSQSPLNAPLTPAYTPSPYGHPCSNSDHSAVSATQYFPPPPQSQANQQQPESNPQPVYYPPPPNAPIPAPDAAYQYPAQPQNAHTAEQVQFQQVQPQPPLPPAYSQAQCSNNVTQTYGQPTASGTQTPLSPQSPAPPPYSSIGQHPQSIYPQEKQQFQQVQPQDLQSQQQCLQPFQAQSYGQPLIQPTRNINPAFLPAQAPLRPRPNPTPIQDDQTSSKAKRFFGDTLVGRVARSGVATLSSTLKLPAALSPWGDNNPVTLPNVRYRDAVLFGTFAFIGCPLVDGASNLVTDAFGADALISEVVSSGAGFITGNCIVKYGVFQIVEQAIDKGILEHVLPEVEKTLRTTSVKSLQVVVKHKLMGVDADLRFVGTYPTVDATACDKGWFCIK